MLKLLVRLSTLSLGVSFVMCTTASQQSQLASLNDRMSEVINALYSSPLLSKSSSSSTSSEESVDPSYAIASTSTPPQVVFVSSSPSFLEAGVEPTDYAHPTPSNLVTRSVWNYPYEYSYTQYPAQVYGPSPYPASRTFSPFTPQIPNRIYPLPSPIPSPARPAFSNFPIPQPFPSQVPYPSPTPYPSQVPFSTPFPYPSPMNYPAPIAYPNVPLAPAFSPTPFPMGPSLPAPFSPTFPPAFPQPPVPYLQPGYSQIGFPQPGYPQPVYSQLPYPSPYVNPIYSKPMELLSKP